MPHDDTSKQFITKIKSELMDEIIALKTMNLKEQINVDFMIAFKKIS